jgi:predicted metal-dependent hydrolase
MLTNLVAMLNKKIQLRFKCSKRARRLRLQVDESSWSLVAPLKASRAVRLKFLFNNFSWLRRQYISLLNAKQDLGLEQENGTDEVLFWGKKTRLIINYTDVFSYSYSAVENVLVININNKTPLNIYGKTLSKALQCIYILEAKKLLFSKIIPMYLPYSDLQANKINFKTMKTQWGSMSPSGAMSINWLLALAPPDIIEYIYVHEICHVRHKNHGKRFWQLVGKLKPDYKLQEQWLRMNGVSLMQSISREIQYPVG